MVTKVKQMAVAKAPTKGTAMVSWQEKLAAAAARTVEREKPPTSKSIKVSAGGILTMDGAGIPNNALDVVVLEAMDANLFYREEYDSDNPQPPDCYAYGNKWDDPDAPMIPHEKVENPISPECDGCENNEFGSAAKGRGKACKNTKLVACILADDIDDVDKAEIRVLRMPVTSVRNWSGYAREALATRLELPPFAVVTRILGKPHPKNQLEVQFEFVETLEMTDALYEQLDVKIKVARSIMDQPYEPRAEQEARPVKAVGKLAGKLAAAAKGGRR